MFTGGLWTFIHCKVICITFTLAFFTRYPFFCLVYSGPYLNILFYYSLKIFLRFWLAKSTHITTHHNQLLLTKFGRTLPYSTKDIKSEAKLQIMAPLAKKTWGRGWVVLVKWEQKWQTFHSYFTGGKCDCFIYMEWPIFYYYQSQVRS